MIRFSLKCDEDFSIAPNILVIKMARFFSCVFRIPAAGAQLLNNRLKQVAGSTRQLSNKKTLGNGDNEEDQNKTDSLNRINSSDNSQTESTPSTICVEGEETVVIGKVAVESQENSNCELAVGAEADKTDIGNNETLKIAPPSNDSISKDLPQQTSTPNSSKESFSVAVKHGDAEIASVPKFVLDNQRAGLSGSNKDGMMEKRRILQPYKSVLEHLTVPRWVFVESLLSILISRCNNNVVFW